MNKNPVVWGEKLFSVDSLHKDTILQVWHEKDMLKTYLQQKRKVIVSLDYYVDRQSPVCVGECNVYWLWIWTWKDMYNSDPVPKGVTPEEEEYVLGGELCTWSENINGDTMDNRIWTRGYAVSERLWSPKEVHDTEKAQPRLSALQCRMYRRGVKSASTVPSYCEKIDIEEQNPNIWMMITIAEAVTILILIAVIILLSIKHSKDFHDYDKIN